MTAGGDTYDQIGGGYAARRRSDPRWLARLERALGDWRSLLNVGAGAGSYEPTRGGVVALEPSRVMIGQRPAAAAPVVRGVAEHLPFRDGAFDVALAVLTLHHWSDPAAGLAEMRRVARRQVVLTWDPSIALQFWLVRDYLPEIGAREAGLATVSTAVRHLEAASVEVLPVPADCSDGVLGAYWRRPHVYLDPAARAAISGLALLSDEVVKAAMGRLAADLDSGAWQARHADLARREEIDLGYRLVVATGARA